MRLPVLANCLVAFLFLTACGCQRIAALRLGPPQFYRDDNIISERGYLNWPPPKSTDIKDLTKDYFSDPNETWGTAFEKIKHTTPRSVRLFRIQNDGFAVILPLQAIDKSGEVLDLPISEPAHNETFRNYLSHVFTGNRGRRFRTFIFTATTNEVLDGHSSRLSAKELLTLSKDGGVTHLTKEEAKGALAPRSVQCIMYIIDTPKDPATPPKEYLDPLVPVILDEDINLHMEKAGILKALHRDK